MKDLQETYGEAMLDPRPDKAGVSAGKGRELKLSVHHGLKAEGTVVPLTKLCQWFGASRRITYYKDDPPIYSCHQKWN
ncbi:hypothetical protein [Xanthomonas euvesicatoria]|uniref:hypothetical protein n=1 Tax=Xanthomonas euvesicatoria TaxID=456327 RepID=UPI0035569014